MALKTDLRARQTQTLRLTPQIVQSLQILQMPRLDLQRLVQTELERNPLLMRADGTGRVPQPNPPSGTQSAMPGTGWDLDSLPAPSRDLRMEVSEQILLLFDSKKERHIADIFVGALDEAGYVTMDIADVSILADASEAEAEATLLALQAVSDPPGLFARNLRECLGLQLERQAPLSAPMRLLLKHLDLIARRDMPALRRLIECNADELYRMIDEIRDLDPKPGLAFHSISQDVPAPDIVVRKGKNGGWTVTMNREATSEISLDERSYAKLLQAASPVERTFLKGQMRDATSLLQALARRNDTILKIALEIIRFQEPFLRKGVDALKPLTLKTVAENLGIHETTVSRAIANKLVETPRGLFELRYFFPAALATTKGGDAPSAETARHRIRRLISAETATSVLSDAALVQKLHEEGIEIARRTVVKYREAMNIPSSIIRRREKKLRKVRKA